MATRFFALKTTTSRDPVAYVWVEDDGPGWFAWARRPMHRKQFGTIFGRSLTASAYLESLRPSTIIVEELTDATE